MVEDGASQYVLLLLKKSRLTLPYLVAADGRYVCRPGLWEQMTQQNDFVVVCACAAGLFLMLGSMSLQWGMALTGMAICLPFQIAVSLSVGEPSILGFFLQQGTMSFMWH